MERKVKPMQFLETLSAIIEQLPYALELVRELLNLFIAL